MAYRQSQVGGVKNLSPRCSRGMVKRGQEKLWGGGEGEQKKKENVSGKVR